MTPSQHKSFNKLRLYFYKHNPDMLQMYLNMGSVQNPSVILEFQRKSYAIKNLKNNMVTDFIDTLVPEHLIEDFKKALTKKI
jgi:hypothetical protein